MKPISMLDLKAEFAEIEPAIRDAIDAVLESQHFIGGPQVTQLEQTMTERLGVADAVAISNGTDALLVALMALNIDPGDEVITTPFTFFGTAGSIHRVGARPVFVDIEPDSFNIDPARIEAAITPRTRAIMPVHLFGQCARMETILEIAERRAVAIVEDAAQAIGATREIPPGRGSVKFAGSIGSLGCFSFYPTKNLGGFGEGGMITTNDQALAAKCRQLRNHGETSRYHHQFVGGNFRLDTLKAAMLLVKAERLNRFNARRRQIASMYDEGLAGLEGVQTPRVTEGNVHTYHQYSILCDDRDGLARHLASQKIGSGIYYPVPLHQQECFAALGYSAGDFPVSERTSRHILSLPVHPMLSDADVMRVATEVKKYFETAAAARGVAVGGA